VLAILLTLLFRPQQTGPGLITRLRETLAQKSGRGHPLSGTKETWVAPFAPRLTLHALSTTSVNRQGPPSMPRAELSINGLKSWGRDWLRLVEKTGVPAASNALKTPGAVEFTTKTEPTPMVFWFWTRPAINATPWCSRWRLSWAVRSPNRIPRPFQVSAVLSAAEGATHALAPRNRGWRLTLSDLTMTICGTASRHVPPALRAP